MPDQITYASTTISITDGFDVKDRPLTQVVDEVNISDSDFAFIVNRGYSFRRVTASGLETFATIEDAQLFIGKIFSAIGNVCTIEHVTLAPLETLLRLLA